MSLFYKGNACRCLKSACGAGIHAQQTVQRTEASQRRDDEYQSDGDRDPACHRIRPQREFEREGHDDQDQAGRHADGAIDGAYVG